RSSAAGAVHWTRTNPAGLVQSVQPLRRAPTIRPGGRRRAPPPRPREILRRTRTFGPGLLPAPGPAFCRRAWRSPSTALLSPRKVERSWRYYRANWTARDFRLSEIRQPFTIPAVSTLTRTP